jgi:NADPH:quinone reductase-like Zn-dependent oxidoreductase
LPAAPSYELAGVVEASGEEVIALTPFDRDGVAADYAVVPEALLAPKPARLDHEQAAALPMPALSAWQGSSSTARSRRASASSSQVPAGASGTSRSSSYAP